MSDKSFLDTNIFIYSHDPLNPIKQSIASDLIRSMTVSGEGVISYQVIQEFFNIALRQSKIRLSHDDCRRYLHTTFRPLQIVAPSAILIAEGINIQQRYQLSWYDSLIVSAAQQGGCTTLFSEDLQDGQHFGATTVRNPFR